MANPYEEEEDRAAAFAGKFMRNATGATYDKYRGQLDAAAERAAERDKAEYEALQLRDPRIGNLEVARRREDRLTEEGKEKRNLDRERLTWQQQKAKIGEDISRLRAETDKAREERILNEALFKQKKELRRETQTASAQAYLDGMMEKGVQVGSPEFAYGVGEVLRQNPYLEPEFKKSIVDSARIEVDPEEIEARIARGDRVTETTDAQGRPKFTFTSQPKEEPTQNFYRDRQFYANERDKIQKMAAGEKDPAKRAPLEAKITEYNKLSQDADAKIRGIGSKATPAEPTAASMVSDRDSLIQKRIDLETQANRLDEGDPIRAKLLSEAEAIGTKAQSVGEAAREKEIRSSMEAKTILTPEKVSELDSLFGKKK